MGVEDKKEPHLTLDKDEAIYIVFFLYVDIWLHIQLFHYLWLLLTYPHQEQSTKI